jgi:C-terminal processing protease CtpA/Prc
MLAELRTSHTQFYTPEDTAYYQLADIFIDSLRRHGLDRIFPSGEIGYSGIGAFTNEDDQHRTVVTGVVEDTPAHQAGLLIGDEILAADDLPFRPVASFRGKVGVAVALSVRRDPGGFSCRFPSSSGDRRLLVAFWAQAVRMAWFPWLGAASRKFAAPEPLNVDQ